MRAAPRMGHASSESQERACSEDSKELTEPDRKKARLRVVAYPLSHCLAEIITTCPWLRQTCGKEDSTALVFFFSLSQYLIGVFFVVLIVV